MAPLTPGDIWPVTVHHAVTWQPWQKWAMSLWAVITWLFNSWWLKDSDIVQCVENHLRLSPLSPFVHPSRPTLLTHGCSSHHHNWAGSLSCVDRPRLASTMIGPACLTLDTMGLDKQWRCWPILELTEMGWSEETSLFHPEQLDNNWEIHIPLTYVRVRCVTLLLTKNWFVLIRLYNCNIACTLTGGLILTYEEHCTTVHPPQKKSFLFKQTGINK